MFWCADKGKLGGWKARSWMQPAGRMTTGLPAANTIADFPRFHLRSLYEAATRAVTPKQSRAAITPRGHVG